MNEDNKLLNNDSREEQAIYRDQIISEYRNNPLIEALPDILSKEEVVKKLLYYPEFNHWERTLEPHLRLHTIQRLFSYFQPLNIHIDLERRISRMIRQGYIHRNPLDREFVQLYGEGHEAIINKDYSLMTSNASTSANSMMLIGISGTGKTQSLNRILSLYPKVIVHSKYKTNLMSQYQVTWLKIDIPHDGSVKGFCVQVLVEIDNLLGTNYYSKLNKGNASANTMLPIICQIARRCGIGLIIVDEVQHLSLAKSGGAEKMLNFFVTLINTINIPVVMVGTNKAMDVLSKQLRFSRRQVGQGDIYFDRIKDSSNASWNLFADPLFDYQWTKREIDNRKEIKDALYEESQGIFDLAIKLYAMSQVRAISTGKEELSVEIIRKTADESFKIIKPILDAIKSGNQSKLLIYDDLKPIEFNDYLIEHQSTININSRIKEIQDEIKKTTSNKSVISEEVLLKLISLGYDHIKSRKLIEEALRTQNDIDSEKELIKAVFRIMDEKDTIEDRAKIKYPKDKVTLKNNDIRSIVQEGMKDELSSYNSLKRAGLIWTIQ